MGGGQPGSTQNMRDHTMGQQKMMSRMLNRYRFEDVYGIGGFQSEQRIMFPRGQPDNYRESGFDDEDFPRMGGHDVYSESRPSGEVRQQQLQEHYQQQQQQNYQQQQ